MNTTHKILSAAVLVLLAAGVVHGAVSTLPTGPEDGPQPESWSRRETGYFKSVDGKLLHYSVLLPRKTGRFPVALIYSGYDTGSIGGSAFLQNNDTFSVDLIRTLIQAGYAVVGVNASSTGCSDGDHFSFLGRTYGEDGRDAVEFAASQAWSSGSVGMFGWSWSGMAQLATASNRPPHLKAIVPGMVLGDPRLDNSAPGGVVNYSMANEWRTFLRFRWDAARQSAESEHDEQCLRNLHRNLQLEEETSWSRELLRHPLRDAWAEEQRLSARTHFIEVPVLSMESFQDGATSSREDYYHETLDPNRTWLLQTNGGHDLYEAKEFQKILLRFFDRFVKGVDNGFDRQPHLTVWMGTHSDGKGWHGYMLAATPSWQFTSASLSPTVVPAAFALSKGGQLLAADRGSGEADAYDYPVPGPSVDVEFTNDTWGPLAQDWKSGALAYTSAPLDHDILTYGPASADLWLSSDAADVDLQVTLTEVRPDGQEMFMQRGWLRVSDRALDPSRSTPLRPVLLDRPDSMRPLDRGEPTLVRLEVNKFSAVFPKGSRIRIWIDVPSPTGEYSFSYVSWPARVHIWHDSEHPSRLMLGELHNIPIKSEVVPCGFSLKLPCRADPLSGGSQP